MRIDIHAHIGRHDERRIHPDAISAYAEQCGLNAVFVSNLDAASHGPHARNADETDANTAVLTAARSRPRLRALYWVRPGRFDSNLYAFAGAMDAEPFLGAVFAPLLNGYRADDEMLDPYLQVLSRLKKVALFLTARAAPARPSRVYEIARRHPRLPFILYNAAADTHWREALDCVEQSRHRKDARLYLDTAHAAAREIVAAVKMIGAEHVLFGSDALDRPEEHARNVSQVLDQLLTTLSERAQSRVAGANAAELFHLEPVENVCAT